MKSIVITRGFREALFEGKAEDYFRGCVLIIDRDKIRLRDRDLIRIWDSPNTSNITGYHAAVKPYVHSRVETKRRLFPGKGSFYQKITMCYFRVTFSIKSDCIHIDIPVEIH